jgi:hypothetical protein
MLLQRIRAKFLKSPVGLLPQIKDERDFQVGWFWAGAYEPKHDKHRLKTRYPKNQYANTCGWVSATGMKEIDEGADLDERTLVMFGRENNLISGDGFSRLRDNQRMLQTYGVAPKGLLPDDRSSWSNYSNPAKLTKAVRDAALKHRSKSYLAVTSISDAYRALDEDRPVQIGIDWYTGWNMSGGFKLPWIIHKAIGSLVGGHAMYLCGYDRNRNGQKVFIVRNSYGKEYAECGDLYITEAMLAPNIARYGAFINYDLDKDIIGWLKIHAGQVVKSDQSANVYLISGDTKRLFKDLATLYAWNFTDADIVIVHEDILKEIKNGPDMSFWEGKNVKAIKTIIQQQSQLKPIFSKYFSELF